MDVSSSIRTKDQHIETLLEENRDLKQQVRDLLLLNEPGFFVDIKSVVNIIHQKVTLISRAESSLFFIFDRQDEQYKLMINRGIDPALADDVIQYIKDDPDSYLADEIPQFHISLGFLLLPVSRRHKPLALICLKLTKKAPENIAELLPLLSQSAAFAVDNALMYEKMLQKLLALSNVFILGKEIVSTLDVKALIKKFLTLCCEAAGVEVAALYLFDAANNCLEKPVILDRDKVEYEINNLSGINTRVINRVLETGDFIHVESLADNEEFADETFHFKGLTQSSTLCLPMSIHGAIMGVVQFSNKSEGRLSGDDIDLLKILINQIAHVLQNSRLYVDLHNAYLETASAFAAALDDSLPLRSGHSLNVARLAEIFGAELDLSLSEKRNLQLSAFLHDIGKLGFPFDLLSKDNFTNEDRLLMESHVDRGMRQLENVPYLKPICKIIQFHHERWDGKGYPQGISGEEIPRLSRILTLLDSFEAMTHPRPYRTVPLPLKKAYDQIEKESGKQFDPDLVSCFLKMIEEGKI